MAGNASPKRTGKGRWKLEDAKARFSELVRRASSEGPQTVTVRGRETVVVVSAEQYGKLRRPKDRLPLVDFLQSLDLAGLDFDREPDFGRDVEL
jgi:prevent-host-death family protein